MMHSLAARLSAAITLVVLGLTLVGVTLTGLSLGSWSDESLSHLLERDEAAWTRRLAQEDRLLVSLSRAAVPGPVGDSLQAAVDAQRELLGVDLLLYASLEGGVRAVSPAAPVAGLDALLRGSAPGVLALGDVPYRAVSRRLEVDGRAVGHLVVGNRLGPVLLELLAQERGLQGLLAVGAQPVAQALDAVTPEALQVAADRADSEGVVTVQGTKLMLRRPEVAPGLSLVLVRDVRAESARFRSSLWLIVALGLLLALGTGGAAFLLARWLLAPLRQLTATTARMVAEGDFRGTLEVRSQDEVGQLAASFVALMSRLRELLLALRNSAEHLESASTQLTDSASVQNEAVSQQAIALHETQLAAQQLQEASRAAAKRVEAIQREAEKASGFGAAGEAAVSGSVGGLTHIRSHVETIGRTIAELHQRTRQVGDITRTVKDLADQSNVLALNASIEAARSGDAGRSFAVVARQMRSLADQSAGATTRVQSILGDIGRAISDAVRTSEGGAREVEGGLEQVRAAGESLRSLAGIIQNNGQTVRSIAEAVSQQDAGIAELFMALSSMADLADQIVDRMAATDQSAIQLSAASQELSAIISQYQV
ncbi:methyl-accepting chemotaxis protein [Pyxidicoccus xibeiensis]|uniref:methyl-accepting chemotaxis protein n=1 Tax=Pyxidicoccus xibeiensis TaxID=2906759 RepID=UPI0020A70E28|nr:methyl-accepting chemotaxis protein [Pyxidicoccus xibeiensis]MCP3138895.1 methyl-accepting chemotaxis protein [Pyxidicoccus xibeiensis]